jgi:hypothetical protein
MACLQHQSFPKMTDPTFIGSTQGFNFFTGLLCFVTDLTFDPSTISVLKLFADIAECEGGNERSPQTASYKMHRTLDMKAGSCLTIHATQIYSLQQLVPCLVLLLHLN